MIAADNNDLRPDSTDGALEHALKEVERHNEQQKLTLPEAAAETAIKKLLVDGKLSEDQAVQVYETVLEVTQQLLEEYLLEHDAEDQQ